MLAIPARSPEVLPAMLSLPSVLTHTEAADIFVTLKQWVGQQPGAELIVDASALAEFDSSALAILLACRREVMAAGKTFLIHGLPARLRQLVDLYGVETLIPVAA